MILLNSSLPLSGTDTTSTFIEWSILYLIKYPDVQAKLHQIISKEIGQRAATLADRSNLPYVDCFMDECFRCSHMMDIAVPHRVVQDTTFKGYLFPKDTQVFADMDAVLHDPKYWKDPEEFRPERFLNEEGKHKSDPRMGIFGIGKRRCMGEVLARGEMFLFIVGLIQKFEFRRAADGEEPCLEPKSGLISYPQEQEVTLAPRY